jgi:DNA-binding LacI/PurR family transcriptional regulator
MAVLENSKVRLNGGLPKYKEISSYLLKKILSGDYMPGDKLPSEKELSGMFDVSQVSVRGALRKLNEEGHIVSCKGKGSFVEKPHKIMDSPKSGTIGFYMDVSRQHAYTFTSLIHGISTAAQMYGLGVQIMHPAAKKIRYDKHLEEIVKSGKLDGLIVDLPAARAGVSWDDFRALERLGIPFILLGNYKDGLRRYIANSGEAFLKILDQTLSLKYRKIATVLGVLDKPEDFSVSYSQVMLTTYKRTIRESYLPLRDGYIIPDCISTACGYKAGRQLFSLSQPPEVVICFDDYIAMGVIKAAYDMGLKVPRDVKVWGAGNLIKPSFISTVAFDWEQLGGRSITMLVQEMEGETPEKFRCDFKLIHRESSSEEPNGDLLSDWINHYFIQYPLDKDVLSQKISNDGDIEKESEMLGN